MYRRQIEADFVSGFLASLVAGGFFGVGHLYATLVSMVFAVAALGVFITGFKAYALSKGQHEAWGILGLAVVPSGWLVLLALYWLINLGLAVAPFGRLVLLALPSVIILGLAVAPFGWLVLLALPDKAKASEFPDATFHVAMKQATKSEARGDLDVALSTYQRIARECQGCLDRLRTCLSNIERKNVTLERIGVRQTTEYEEVVAEATNCAEVVRSKMEQLQQANEKAEWTEVETEPPLPVRPARLAIVAGYSTFSAFAVYPAPAVLLLGVLALRDLSRRPDKYGRARAVIAITGGSLGTLFLAAHLLVVAFE